MTMTEITTALSRLPGVQALITKAREDEAASVHAERIAAAKEIESLLAAELALIRAHDKAVAPLDRDVNDLKAALTAATSKRDALVLAHRTALFERDQKRGRLTAFLEGTGPRAAIESFCKRLTDELERQGSLADHVGDQWSGYVWSNAESLRARATAICELRVRARELLIAPLTAAELDAKFDELWSGLPVVESKPAKYQREAQ